MAKVESLTKVGIQQAIDSAVDAAIEALPDPVATFDSTAASNLMATRRMEWEIVETSPGVYPARPVYTGPVRWKGTQEPATTGTTSSGTTAVPGLDYWRHLS